MDTVDVAQEINLQLQQDALLQHFRRGIRNAMYSSDLTCSECGDEIPVERRGLAKGCTRCLKCQEQHELLSHWRPV